MEQQTKQPQENDQALTIHNVIDPSALAKALTPPEDPKAPKPGYRTSEFFVTVAGLVISVLVMMGKIAPEDAAQVTQAVTSGIASLTVLISVCLFVWGRVKLKK
jgi:hypothetical protein